MNKWIGHALAAVATTGILFVQTAGAQEPACYSGALFYDNKAYMALTTEAEKKAYAVEKTTSLWGSVSGEVANIGNLYGMGQGLGAAAFDATSGNAAIEEALTLSADRMAQLLKGKTYTVGRVQNVLRGMRNGSPPGATIGNAFTVIGAAIDVVNVLNHSINAMQTGDYRAKAQAAQAAMSLTRTGVGASWGGAMGPMMAMAGFLDYAINAFGNEAYAQYDAYWWGGYKGYHAEMHNFSAERWLEIFEAEGQQGIRARLDKFWDNADYNAATYQDARTISQSTLAAAEYRDRFANHYMIEVIEPKIASAFESRATDAMYAAMDEYERICLDALEEARAVEATLALLEGMGDSISVDDVYDALIAGDTAKVRDYVVAGFDANEPPDFERGENNWPFMYYLGYEMVKNPQMQSGMLQLIQGGAKTRFDWAGVPSPVAYAVREENARAAYALIHLGYPVDFVFTNGRSLMAEAARLGMTDVVQAILDRGIDPDYAEQEESPALLYAAAHGHTEVVRTLIDARADVNAVTKEGGTALHLSARAGHEQIVRMLVEAGADVERKIGSSTAADVARKAGQIVIADYLDKLSKPDESATLVARVPKLVEPGLTGEVALTMEGGWKRPLQFTVRTEPPGVIKFQNGGFDDKWVSESYVPEENRLYAEAWFDTLGRGTTQLEITVSDASGNSETIRQSILIGEGYSHYRGRLVDAAKAFDTGAIREAISQINEMDKVLGNDPKWIEQLMRDACVRGDNRNCEAYLSGFVAYHVAATDDVNLLDWLLQWGADPNYLSSLGDPIAFNAARAGKWDSVAKLLAAGANPNATGNDGGSVLLYAVGANQTGIVQKLLAAGADPDLGSVTKGMSPLHHAAANNNRDIISMLRNAGARITEDAEGHTPGWFSYWAHKDLQLALSLGYDEAQGYEDRANEPEFDWNEFMVGLNQRLVDQGYGQQSQVDSGSADYSLNIPDGFFDTSGDTDFGSSGGTSRIINMPGVSYSGPSDRCRGEDLWDLRGIEEKNGQRKWSNLYPIMVSPYPCSDYDLAFDADRVINVPGIGQTLYTSEEDLRIFEQNYPGWISKDPQSAKGFCLANGQTAESARRCGF